MFLYVIPFIGWIAYVVLAIAGCYFFLTSGFSFEQASRAEASGTVPTSIQDAFYKICMQRSDEWLRGRQLASGQSTERFCRCSSQAVYVKLTVQELEYWQKHRTNTAEFQAVAAKAIAGCISQ